MNDDDFPRPPQWLVDSQRINLRMATPAIIHLARRLQIVAFEREGGGYSDSKGDPDQGALSPLRHFISKWQSRFARNRTWLVR